MNVEGDYRYVDSGAFDECVDFLDFLEEHEYEWDEAFVGWAAVSQQLKEYQKPAQNYWDAWNLVKVLKVSGSCKQLGVCVLSRNYPSIVEFL